MGLDSTELQNLQTIADNMAADELTARNILQFRNDTLSYRIAPEEWPQAKRGNIAPDKPDEQAILYGNYPDPFNKTTVIRYYLPEGKTGFIKITDIAGKEIRLLRLSSLKQTITFNRNQLPNGIYIIQMTVDGDIIGTDKMILQ